MALFEWESTTCYINSSTTCYYSSQRHITQSFVLLVWIASQKQARRRPSSADWSSRSSMALLSPSLKPRLQHLHYFQGRWSIPRVERPALFHYILQCNEERMFFSVDQKVNLFVIEMIVLIYFCSHNHQEAVDVSHPNISFGIFIWKMIFKERTHSRWQEKEGTA